MNIFVVICYSIAAILFAFGAGTNFALKKKTLGVIYSLASVCWVVALIFEILR